MKTREQIRKRYRIVTDGEKFRIQQRFLFWWETAYRPSMFGECTPFEFDSRLAVDAVLKKWVEDDYKSQRKVWEPI